MPILKTHPSTSSFVLYFDHDGLKLQLIDKKAPGPIWANFISGKAKHRRTLGGGKNQAIAKAIGLKGKYLSTILDATAGLGRDAFVLASLGCQVTLLENSVVIAALLEDGLKRAAADTEISSIIARMKLVKMDSIQYMQKYSNAQNPDVVYLDPMFPERKKSALVKKEMRVLGVLLNSAFDEKEILDAARKCAKKRVVVKRPRLAPTLAKQNPNFSIKGKSCRFDVYLQGSGSYAPHE